MSRNHRTKNNMSPYYDLSPCILIECRGNMIVPRRGCYMITRNSSFFKKVNVVLHSDFEGPDNIPLNNPEPNIKMRCSTRKRTVLKCYNDCYMN